MKKRIFLSTLLIFSLFSTVFSATDIPLLKSVKEQGITLYWDSLSETGILEKNGHQITFRKDESILLLDNQRMIISEPPLIKNNQIMVSTKFLNDAQSYFNDSSSSLFKVGAIIIDAGHGGKDPGALKTYKINNKNSGKRCKSKSCKITCTKIKSILSG